MGNNNNLEERKLYVGNIDPLASETDILDLFSQVGLVSSVKIITDKAGTGFNFGFVEFEDRSNAETAIDRFNSHLLFSSELKVNWAFQSSNKPSYIPNNYPVPFFPISQLDPNLATHHLFIGDLSPEVGDEILQQAFIHFKSLTDARVMWDHVSGKSRGYGFVGFSDKTEAETALVSMKGVWVGSRAIRLNWANQRGGLGTNRSMTNYGNNNAILSNQQQQTYQQPIVIGELKYEEVVVQSSSLNTTIYVGNLSPITTQEELVAIFGQFGYIVDIKLQIDKGYAFLKMDTHENAAVGICYSYGVILNSRPLKTSWGRDKIDQPYQIMHNNQYANQHYQQNDHVYNNQQYQLIPVTNNNGMPTTTAAASYNQYLQQHHHIAQGGYGVYAPQSQNEGEAGGIQHQQYYEYQDGGGLNGQQQWYQETQQTEEQAATDPSSQQ